MRLHDRYLFRELLVPLGFCLGGFLIFWIAFDLFGRLDDFQELRFGLREILLYYLFDLPKLLNTALRWRCSWRCCMRSAPIPGTTS